MTSLGLYLSHFQHGCSVLSAQLQLQKRSSSVSQQNQKPGWEENLFSFFAMISPGRPLIFVPPVDQFEINNGSSAVFQCEASAVPEHDVFWTFTNSDGITLSIISTTESDTDKYQVNRTRGIGAGFGELTVIGVQYEDRGTYTCTAMNSVGSDVSDASLTVQGEPI